MAVLTKNVSICTTISDLDAELRLLAKGIAEQKKADEVDEGAVAAFRPQLDNLRECITAVDHAAARQLAAKAKEKNGELNALDARVEQRRVTQAMEKVLLYFFLTPS